MADLNHSDSIKTLHHHGFITRSDITSALITGWDNTLTDKGRADIMASRMGRTVYIEVKNGRDNFDLTDWREEQRNWARYVEMEPFCTPYWLFLTIGINPASWNPDKYLPKRSWLIPRLTLLDIDAKVRQYQNRLVYKAKKGMRKEIQAQKLDALTLLAEYELHWNKQNTLEKPPWLDYWSYLGIQQKTEDKLEKIKNQMQPKQQKNHPIMYGGLWTIPDSHSFHKNFIAKNCDTIVRQNE